MLTTLVQYFLELIDLQELLELHKTLVAVELNVYSVTGFRGLGCLPGRMYNQTGELWLPLVAKYALTVQPK